MVDLFAELASNATLATAFQGAARASSYDDYVVLALLALGGAGYLTRGSLWDKPDPYHYKWFERPQESSANGTGQQKETRNIAQKLEETQRDLVIFWGSQSGTAEGFAHRLARDCHRRFRLNAFVADLSDYDSDTIQQIPESKFAIFVISTYGEGDPSDNSADFLSWINTSTSVSLPLLRYAAFGLGNSNYKYYNKVVDVVVEGLERCGAASMLPVGKADDASGTTEEDFLEWKERLFRMFTTRLGLEEGNLEYEPSIQVVEDESMTSIDLFLGEPKPQRTARKTIATTSSVVAIPIKETKELFQQKVSGQSCIHMDLDLTSTPEIRYKTGDHLAVWPINPDQEVARLLRVLNLELRKEIPLTILALDSADTKIKIPTPTTALALFQHYLEICAPVSRETVLSLAQFAPTSEAKGTLMDLGTDKAAYARFLNSNHVTLARLLELTNANWSALPLSFVIESLAPMMPRYYSVSSSSAVTPRMASITVVVSNKPLPSNPATAIPGLATSYLSSLTSSPINSDLKYPSLASNRLSIQMRKSTFKLPASPSTPLILIGAGTGIAPLRAFVLERARLHSIGRISGPILLFFGCRHPNQDYLYRDELEALASSSGALSGVLGIITAFSRDPAQPKKYVQDRISETTTSLKMTELLLNQDSGLYLCGSASMARDVGKEIGRVVAEKQGWDDRELKGWIEGRKRVGRWREDVWG